jgi:hypothetical protein
LTHRPKRIETVEVLKLIEGSAFISEPSCYVPAEAKTGPTEKPKLKKAAEQLKALSPPREMELPKALRIPATTLRKRRMASVLDAVMESMKASTPASVEVPSSESEILKKSDETSTTQAVSEAGPSVFVEARPLETAPLILEKEGAPEKSKSFAPEAPAEEPKFIVRHASGKQLSEEQIAQTRQYNKDLKYPQGSLVYSGNDENDFLYCLPDNKEIYVCREMMKNMGYPKLELGLSAMSKDDLADSLAYNSLRFIIKLTIFVAFLAIIMFSYIFIIRA